MSSPLPRYVNSLLRKAIIAQRTRGGGSNLYNRVHGSVPSLYVEQLYDVDEARDTVPHSTDGGHPMFPKFAEATPQGRRPYNAEIFEEGFALFFWLYGVIGIIFFLHMLRYWSTWRHLFETLTLQYTYEREIGEEYFWQYGGVIEPNRIQFIKNPLEELGLVKEYRTDMDSPDDY